MADTPKKRNWTIGGIIGIACIVLGFYFLIQADYRPTAGGTDTYNILAGICFAAFVGLIIYAFAATKKGQ